MNSYLIISRQIVFMFSLMSVGFLLSKLRLINAEGTKTLANILIYCTTPIVVITSYMDRFTEEKALRLLLSFCLATLIHLLFILLAGMFRIKDPIIKNAAVIPNTGYMGIPLVSSVLGEEAVFYLSAFIAMNQLIIWTYCVSNLDPDYKISYRQLFRTPIYYSILIGLFLFVTGINLPSLASRALTSIKSLNTPLSMFVLGSYISRISFKQAFKDIGKIYPSIVYRLLLFPCFALIMLKLLPESLNDIRLIAMICASSPTAFNVAFFAEKYGHDVVRSTEADCISTLLCILTIPLFSYLVLL